jgi:hypothetical protein
MRYPRGPFAARRYALFAERIGDILRDDNIRRKYEAGNQPELDILILGLPSP